MTDKLSAKVARLEMQVKGLEKLSEKANGLERERIGYIKEAIILAKDELDHKLQVASKELDRRLETMNEFRAQVLEERSNYARRDQMDILLDVVRGDIKNLEHSKSYQQGRDWAFGIIIIAIASSVGALLSILLQRIVS